MRKLPDSERVALKERVSAMVSVSENRGYEFRSDWVKDHEWIVVPIEDFEHFTEDEVERIIATLTSAGYEGFYAVGVFDLPEPLPNAYEIDLSAEDLQAFNAECGPFRFLLLDRHLAWAISSNEWFKLFAGPPALIEQMVGAPLEQAREEFLEYARAIEQGDEGGLVGIAREYGCE